MANNRKHPPRRKDATAVVVPRMPENQKRQLIARAQTGDESARARLIAAHMGIIVHTAQRFYRPGMFLELSDLIQQGCLGVLRAIEKFDPAKLSGGRHPAFVTYAMYWIQHAIRREISSRGNCVTLPYRGRKRSQVTGLLEMNTGEPVYSLVSLRLTDEALEDPARGELIILPAPAAEDPHAIADLETQKSVVQRWIRVLSEEERFVLDHFYGLNDREPVTPADIGRILGISEGRVNQIRLKAVRRLRRLVDVNVSPYHGPLGPVLLSEKAKEPST